MHRRRRGMRLLGMALVVALAVGVSACGSSGKSSSGAPNPKLNVVIGGSGLGHILPLIAQKLGLYQKYGVDVTLTSLTGGGPAGAAIISGKADVANVSGSDLVDAILKGADMKFIAATDANGTYYVMSKPSVNSAADLRGKKIAVPSLGGGFDNMLRQLILPKFGLTSGPNPPTILAAGSTPAGVAGTAAGKFDAVLVSFEQSVSAQSQGLKPLITPDQLAFKWFVGNVATGSAIKNKRDAIERFVKAEIEAIYIMKTQPTNAVVHNYLKTYYKLSDDLINKFQTSFAARANPDMSVPDASVATLLQTATDKSAAATATTAQFIDNSLVQDLIGQGFLTKFQQ